MKTCTVDGCEKKYHSHGMCRPHVWRLRKHGTLSLPPKPSREEVFWSRVEKTNSCWNWTAGKGRGGYGAFQLEGHQHISAHRYAFQLAKGEIPEGMIIDHMCHNRACVNPEHLRAVTYKQNAENKAPDVKTGMSGVLGVYPQPPARWRGRLFHDGVRYEVGTFTDIKEAEAAVIAKRLELFTHNDVDRRDAA